MAVLTLGGSACTEPQFVIEEGADGGLSRDAGGRTPVCRDATCRPANNDEPTTSDPVKVVPNWPVEQMQKWAEPLLGRYAMRARYFTIAADGSQEQHRVVAIAEIAGGKPETNYTATLTTTQLCEHVTEVRGASTVTRRWRRAEYVGRRSYQLLFDHKNLLWYSTYEPWNLGWVPNACVDKSARPAQPWRTGECKCPTSNVDDLPTAADDCRVSDGDGDRFEGVQLWQTGPNLDVTDRVVVREKNGFGNGIVAADRKHTANFVVDVDQFSTVQCTAGHECARETTHPCPPNTNDVELVPDPAYQAEGTPAFTCASILDKAGTLFTNKALEFPDCQFE